MKVQSNLSMFPFGQVLECIVWLQSKTCSKPLLLKLQSTNHQHQHLPGRSLELKNLGLRLARTYFQVIHKYIKV